MVLFDEYVEFVCLFDMWDWFYENNLKVKCFNYLYYLILYEEFKEIILEMFCELYYIEN